MQISRLAVTVVAAIWLTATAGRAAMLHDMDAAMPGQPAASLKTGVYTEAQAARGKALYQAHCVTCHLELRNATPPLAGEAFRTKWASLTVDDLFTKMRETMPTVEPGMLTPAEYIDLVAFILNANNVPAGAKELTADGAALKALSLADLPRP